MNKSLLMASLIAAVALAACGKKPEEVVAPAPMEAASAPAPMASAPMEAASAPMEAASAAADAASK
ncbi:MAG: hypothetical protein ABI574_02005 [Burkholderiales bacterium]